MPCLFLLSQCARPEDRAEGTSFVETVSSGHMVKSHDHREVASTADNCDACPSGTAGKKCVDNACVADTASGDANELNIPSDVSGKKGGLLDETDGLKKKIDLAKTAYVDASKAVWEMNGEAPDLNKNFIRQTGADWMSAVSAFKSEASSMRLEAENVYKEIVQSHTGAAKKMMITMKTEMSKLKSLKGYTTKMGEVLKTAPAVDEADTFYGNTKKGDLTKAEIDKAKAFADNGNLAATKVRSEKDQHHEKFTGTHAEHSLGTTGKTSTTP